MLIIIINIYIQETGLKTDDNFNYFPLTHGLEQYWQDSGESSKILQSDTGMRRIMTRITQMTK